MKLAILDRDGTLNALGDGFIASPDEWVPVPGALEAVARLNHAGWHVVVATNQPGLGRGLFDAQTLVAIHAKMHRQLATLGGRIDAVFYCPHAMEANCGCRKPKPGLLEDIGRRFNTSLQDVPCIGDQLRDLESAATVGAQPILVLTGKGAKTQREGGLPPNTRVYADLADAVKSLVR